MDEKEGGACNAIIMDPPIDYCAVYDISQEQLLKIKEKFKREKDFA